MTIETSLTMNHFTLLQYMFYTPKSFVFAVLDVLALERDLTLLSTAEKQENFRRNSVVHFRIFAEPRLYITGLRHSEKRRKKYSIIPNQ